MTHTHTPQETGQASPSLLVVGVESQIGSALFGKLSPQSNRGAFGTTRRKESSQQSPRIIHLDLSNPDPFIEKGFCFDHVVFCAGVTSIATCESDPTLCRRVNVDGTSKLIQHFSDCGSHVVFLSSNAVFDGSKPFFRVGDNTCPNSNYGKFKVEVENRFRNNPNVAILRLTKVITATTPFIRKWQEELDRGEEITVFDDRFVSPISIDDVLDSIERLVDRRSSGIYHLGGATEVSYSDYARRFFADNPKALGLLKKRVGPNGAGRTFNSLATHLPTMEPFNYTESTIVFADHLDENLISDIQKVIKKYFNEEESTYVHLPIEDYRDIVKNAQDHLNSKEYVRKICDKCVEAIRGYIREERFFVQTNLYLRATRPTLCQETESIGWHRETFYGPNMEKSVNVWTPILGVNERNTLQFIPKSQKISDSDILINQINDAITTKGSVGNKIGFLYSPKNIMGGVDLKKAMPMNVPEFHSALFSGMLIHGSAQNFSENIRFSVDFRILPFSAYDTEREKKLHLASGKPYFELY